jgi:dCTP diphosphatase
MNDQKTTIQDLKNKFKKFSQDRNWEQFHTAKNLSMCIAAEAAELMEHFMWVTGQEATQELEKKRQEVEHEVADIAFGLLQFCNMHNIDLSSAIESKLQELEERYTIEKSYNRWTKISK